MNSASHHVENWQGSPHQKEYLKVYFLVLQVCHYLMAGQVSMENYRFVKTMFCVGFSNLISHSYIYRIGEKCKTLSETTATEHTNYNVA